MESKKDVYVKVDTKKKAKKLLKVLDMFGDKSCEGTLYAPWVSGKKEVTIKELRNILAAEHLKKGDYFISGVGDYQWLVKFDSFSNGYFRGTYINTEGNVSSVIGSFYNFIRFATDEEIKSFESSSGEKEFTIGKWYKAQVPGGKLYAVYKGVNAESYGIHPSGNPNWFDIHAWFFEHNINKMNYEPATTEEVTEALIKEANRIGYKDGIKAKCSFHNIEIIIYDFNSFVFRDNELWSKSDFGNVCLFKDGKWAEIVKEKELTPDDYKDKTWYKRKSGSIIFIDKSSDSNLGIRSTGYCSYSLTWFKHFQLNEFHVPGVWTEASYEEVADIINNLNK